MRFVPAILAASLLLVVLAGITGCTGGPPAPVARDGVMDLRGVPLEEHVWVLEGTWRARFGADSAAFAAFDYDDAGWPSVPVPAYFTEQGFPDEGLAWYRLRLRLPPDVPPLKGYLQHADNAHAIYVARPGEPPQRIAESGAPALDPDGVVRSRRPVTFTLPADTALVLSWKVANVDYSGGGPFFPIELGTVPAMDTLMSRRYAATFMATGLYLLLAVIFLSYATWSRRDVRALSVGLLALGMSVRTVVTSGALEMLFPATMVFGLRIRIEAASYLMLHPLVAFLFWSLFPREFASLPLGRWRLAPPQPTGPSLGDADRPPLPAWLRAVHTGGVLAAAVGGGIATVVVLLSRPLITSHVLGGARWMTLLLLAVATTVTLSALERRRPLSVGFAAGFALLLAGAVHDVLLAMGVVEATSYVVSYAFLGFVLVMSWTVSSRLVRELHEAIRVARSADAAKTRFLSTISHEVRTPLTTIIGFLQILEKQLRDRAEPQQTKFLRLTQDSARRMLNLLNDLLDLSKAESGHLDLHLDRVDAAAAAAAVAESMQPLVEVRHLTLTHETQCPEGRRPVVHADPERLQQVLLNLVSNALKFTQEGGVHLRVRPAVLGVRPAWAVDVIDSGIGIAPDFLPRLFDHFSQEGRGDSAGSGLGLSIARELVVRMGGRIDVASQLDAGTTFTITLLDANVPVDPSARPTTTVA